MKSYDAIVVGGGFYGCSIAIHLKKAHGLQNVAVIVSANPKSCGGGHP